MRRIALFAAAFGLALAGCGTSDQTPAEQQMGTGAGWTNYAPVAGADPKVLAKLHKRSRDLDAAALAADALESDTLEDLLRKSEFAAGAENEYSGRTDTFNHVVSRVLLFHRDTGALRYLDWLRAHADELIGKIDKEESLALGTNGMIFRQAGCGCHADLPTFLAAWRRGSLVLTVLADGPGVERRDVRDLAREYDDAYEGSA